jgi:hypothetical protein
MERSTRYLAILSGALALSASACGPTKSTALIMDADVELEAARAADGAKLAPYEYTAAEAYLHKAREEQGYADFEVSIDFGQKAVKFAKEAKTKAMALRSEGALPSTPPGLPPPPPPPPTDAPNADKVEKVQSNK